MQDVHGDKYKRTHRNFFLIKTKMPTNKNGKPLTTPWQNNAMLKESVNPQRHAEDRSLQQWFLPNLGKVWHTFKPISGKCFVTAHYVSSRHGGYAL